MLRLTNAKSATPGYGLDVTVEFKHLAINFEVRILTT